jgi:Na+:H+ antiporter, NhaA family
LGGMLVPALLYVSLNTGPVTIRGWGIPMATDIAFALGMLQLMGPRCPIGLKVFLTALAIIDDMGAIAVIALFYTVSLAIPALLLSLATFSALVVLNKCRVRQLSPYLALGIVLWLAVLRSGIHATIAGVLLALTIPAGVRTVSGRALEEQPSPLIRLERFLASGVPYVILPLFALANAGVDVSGARAPWASSIGLGVFLGLFIGKPIGITLFAWIAVKRRWATLPNAVGWRALHGAAWLGGIGFTMALFIASLAFEGSPRLDEAKLSVLLASAFAAMVGRYLVLRAHPTAAVSRRLAADG